MPSTNVTDDGRARIVERPRGVRRPERLEDAVTRLPMFDGLSRRKRRRVERCFTILELPAGHRLWTEGEVGRQFAIVVRGQLGVLGTSGDGSVIGRGGHLGELALLDRNDPVRRASVSVLEPSVVAIASRFEFATLLDLDIDLARRVLGAAVRREADVVERRRRTAAEDVQPHVVSAR